MRFKDYLRDRIVEQVSARPPTIERKKKCEVAVACIHLAYNNGDVLHQLAERGAHLQNGNTNRADEIEMKI